MSTVNKITDYAKANAITLESVIVKMMLDVKEMHVSALEFNHAPEEYSQAMKNIHDGVLNDESFKIIREVHESFANIKIDEYKVERSVSSMGLWVLIDSLLEGDKVSYLIKDLEVDMTTGGFFDEGRNSDENELIKDLYYQLNTIDRMDRVYGSVNDYHTSSEGFVILRFLKLWFKVFSEVLLRNFSASRAENLFWMNLNVVNNEELNRLTPIIEDSIYMHEVSHGMSC